MTRVPYDDFSEIYDVWVETAHLDDVPFMVDAYRAARGPVVELGIGDGRIAIEAARHGVKVIGVDSSRRMLERCRRRADAAGVAGAIELLHADMEDFRLATPAALVAIPFRSFLHKIALEDKLRTLRHIRGQLAPGGRLVFDAFVFDPESAQRLAAPQIRAEYRDARSHRDVVLWMATRYDRERQSIRIITWADELDREGIVVRRKYRRLPFSWLDPDQARGLLVEAGFEIESVCQDYAGTPLGPGARLHIWTARRPDSRDSLSA